MSVVELAPVVKTIEVRRSARDAFRIFTAETSAWWPLASHSRARASEGQRAVRVTIEPRVGGRIYETLEDGGELDWGQVLAYQPDEMFAMSWHLSRPASEATEVTVRFEPLSAATTRVTLTHAHWERWGADAGKSREGYANGWTVVLKGLEDYAN